VPRVLVAHRSDTALEREAVAGLIKVLRRRGHQVVTTSERAGIGGGEVTDFEREAEAADHVLVVEPRSWWKLDPAVDRWEHALNERISFCIANAIEQFAVVVDSRHEGMAFDGSLGALPRFVLPAAWEPLLARLAQTRQPVILRTTGELVEPRPRIERPGLDAALARATAATPSDEGRLVWIRGAIGTGKSSLLQTFVARRQSSRPIVLHVARPGIAATLRPRAVLAHIAAARERSPATVLAIDGLEQMIDRTDALVPESERSELVASLIALPVGVTVIATSRPLAPRWLGELAPTIDLDAPRWATEQRPLLDAPSPPYFAAAFERAFVRLLALPQAIRRAVLAGLALLRIAPGPVPQRVLAASLGVELPELLATHAAEWLRREGDGLALVHEFAARHLAAELDVRDVGPHYAMLDGIARLRQRGQLDGASLGYATHNEPSHRQATRGLSHDELWIRNVRELQQAARAGSLEHQLERAVATARPEHAKLVQAMHTILRQNSLAIASDVATLASVLWTGLVARDFSPSTLDAELSFGELLPAIRLQNSLAHIDRCQRVLGGHREAVRGCGLSRDGSVAVTLGSDGTLRIWDVQAGSSREVRIGGWSETCALTRDGTRVALGSSERVVVLDTRTGEQIAKHEHHKATVTAIAITDDGTRVLSGDRDGVVMLWYLPYNALQLGKHGDRVTRCTIARDGALGLTGGDDRTVRIWSFADAELRAEVRGHSYAIGGLALTRDGKRAVSVCIGEARVWDPIAGREIECFKDLGDSCAGLVATDDDSVLMAESGERVTRFNVDDGKITVRHLAHPLDIHCIAATDDGEWYLTGGADQVGRLWRRVDMAGGELQGTILPICALLPGEQPDTVWVGGGGHGTRLIALADQRKLVEIEGYTTTNALAWFDGQLYVAGSNRRITVYSATTGREEAYWEPGKDWLRTVTVDRVRQRLAFAGDDRQVFVSKLDGSELRSIGSHSDWIHAVAFTPDGRLVAVDGDGHIKLWDLDKKRAVLERHSDANTCLYTLVLDPSGSQVAVAGSGGRIDVFALDPSAKHGKPERSFAGHVGSVRGLALRPDGRVLVSAGTDRTLRLWSFPDARPLASLTTSFPLTQVCFVGERLVVGDVTGNTMIFAVDWSAIEQ
jgi:WD40 repeat protein